MNRRKACHAIVWAALATASAFATHAALSACYRDNDPRLPSDEEVFPEDSTFRGHDASRGVRDAAFDR